MSRVQRGGLAVVALAGLLIAGGASAAARWRVRTVVGANRHVGYAQLAVSENGAAALAWLAGKGPQVCLGGSSCPKPPPWHGFSVMLARRTAANGLGRPIRLSAHAGWPVFVAQLSSGVTYVAWNGYRGGRWRIVAIDHGHRSAPSLLPVHAQLQGLYTGRSRQAAAVWVTVASPAFLIHYAFLGPHGRLHRQGHISMVSRQATYPGLAVNDSGDLAATWGRGPRWTIPMLALCDARNHCVTRQLAARTSQYVSPTVSLADDGTAVDLFGLHSLWGAVARVDRPGVSVVKIADGGRPVVTSDGNGGAASMFNPTPVTLAWTFLAPGHTAFTEPLRVPDPDASNSPVVSANLAGQFVAAWSDGDGQLRASVGAGTRPGRPVALVSPGFVTPAATTQLAGIDGRGNALVAWEGFGDQGWMGLFLASHSAR